jgi:hypothetical protein
MRIGISHICYMAGNNRPHFRVDEIELAGTPLQAHRQDVHLGAPRGNACFRLVATELSRYSRIVMVDCLEER